ncbi:hypothetical protein [Nocardioides bruguierae]|uniref:Uncharacterized protein n=1 Tax=Nocardioides bruguierae TaxID=2945102 RepID=A0A9X2IG88_9ACTN|nr:hypothetical protein [Nocardioides bruguierae]MCM0621773.1 hypothetical protein [Nocardioides bruguierae]
MAASHALEQCVAAVASSPAAVRRLLDALTEQASAVADEPRWEPTLRALERLVRELNQGNASGRYRGRR